MTQGMTNQRRSGFTLLEVMVAIIIGAIVMLGAVQMMQSNRVSFTLVDQYKVIEENARAGIDMLAREARQAGMGANVGVALYSLDNVGALSGALSSLGALSGTDGVELFTGMLSQPICVPISGNENPGEPTMAVDGSSIQAYVSGFEGMQDYDGSSLSMLSSYSAIIYTPSCPATNWCVAPISGAADDGVTATLSINTGVSDDAGRTAHHDCSNVTAVCPGGGGAPTQACLNVGSDIYYYVRRSAAGEDNPQLVRYRVGSAHEAVANFVEDLQITVLDEDNGWADDVADATKISAVHATVLIRHPEIDQKMTSQVIGQIDNSTASAGAADQHRRRVLSRTANIRNR